MKVTVAEEEYLSYLADATKVADRNDVPVQNLKDVSQTVQKSVVYYDAEVALSLDKDFLCVRHALMNAINLSIHPVLDNRNSS